jgi:hypothetical protein
LFPLYRIINGDPRHSDHIPIIAELNEQASMGGDGGGKTFQFEARWLQEEQCEQIITEAWNDAFSDGASKVGEAVK